MKKRRITRASRPNAGIEADYRRRLDRLVRDMTDSVEFWMKSAYRHNPPVMALDRKSPAKQLQESFDKLRKRWLKQFDDAAPKLAKWFAMAAAKRSDATLQRILRDGGFSVRFRMTPAAKDIIDAAVHENVGLIKSIPQQYLTQVEGIVMRSVAEGRNLGPLAASLRKQHGVTKRRAALIARDQNNKATANMTRARQVELGFKAIWMHSHAGREPRPTHVANDGKPYDPVKGWYDPHEKKRIWPGTLINCFPPSTTVEFACDIEKAFRHRYSGQLTEIVTDTGKTLAATPNHPILTLRGWLPISSLNEGDHVIEVPQQCIGSRVVEGDANQGPPLIGQIFHALPGAASFRIAVGGDFHGDVVSDSNIDVVFAERPLWCGRKSLLAQRYKQFSFPVADDAALASCALDQLSDLSLRPTNLCVGGLSEALAAFRTFAVHADKVGSASAAHYASGETNTLCDRAPRDAMPASKREHALTSFMFGTQKARVIKIKRSSFDGHVYNLQTSVGWYVAGGIISHNCRCFTQTIIPGWEQ